MQPARRCASRSSVNTTRIKVCGITRPEDAVAAAAAGADAVGVVFAPSPRQVTAARAAEVLSALPDEVRRVGVFVNPSLEEVAEAVELARLDMVQLHGEESPEFCVAVGMPVAKAVRVGPDFDSAMIEPYRGAITLLLLDTYVPGVAGGTGLPFGWHELAGRLPSTAPIAVGGGLRSYNVAEAIRVLRPFAVDVSSGVEASPGIKDVRLMEAFVAEVRAANREVWNG